MPSQQQQPRGLSLFEKYRLAKYAVRFPALTAMVFLRHSIGFRLVNVPILISITVVLLFFAALTMPDSPNGGLPDLGIFALLFFLFGICHRVRGWLKINRNKHQHSRYVGTSIFNFGWPYFLRRNRRIERFCEPAIFLIAGVVLFTHSHILGLYLAFAGICLKAFETQLYEEERDRHLDIIDDLIDSQLQAQVVEEYEKIPGTHAQATEGIVPAGLDEELKAKIRKRRASLN